MNVKVAACGVLLVLLGWASCSDSSPCDDDQELRIGYCHRIPDAAAPAAVDAAAPVEAAPAFGRPCSVASECVAPATYCALQPGQSVGFCSAFGCDLDPTICPSGWGCMDLTSFGLAAHMCIPGS